MEREELNKEELREAFGKFMEDDFGIDADLFYTHFDMLIWPLVEALEQYSNPEWPETVAYEALEQFKKTLGEK